MNSPEENRITYMETEHTKYSLGQGLSNSPLGAKETVDSGSLDKIRDILFGNQMRDYEKRFARLEERLVKEYADLRDDTRKRLDKIEIYIKDEIDSLTDRINNETLHRDEAVKELGQDLKNLMSSLEKKITNLDEQTSQSQRALRQQILDQSKNLDDEIQQKYEDILSTLEQEAQKLRSDKTDRSVLASLFAELAIRLNNQ